MLSTPLPRAWDPPACRHCGNPVPQGRNDGFCCAGCLAVNRLLAEEGLAQGYYQLRPEKLLPLLGHFSRRPDLDWLEKAPGCAQGRLELNIEGVQCGACVWAIERLAQRRGGAKVGVNSALGRLSLSFDPARFDVRAYLTTLAELGYRVRPLDGDTGDPSRDLLLRLGVTTAIAMNTMSFTLPHYLGLANDGDGIQGTLRWINLALTTLAVGYGGAYFFRRAFSALRAGVAHFDIPIALGVATAYLGSLWSFWHSTSGPVFFDSVNVFLAFMLAGRFIQERTLLRQRRSLLKGDAFQNARVTLLDPTPREIPFADVRAGDRLLLQPGALCPSAAVLEDAGPAEFDRASVTGEPAPSALRRGESLPAGSRLVSARAVIVRCSEDFSAGLLASLASAEGVEEELPVLWRWSVRWYVAFVLTAAFAALGYWLWRNPAMAPRAFIATLVVSCPCGLGIAVPLARTLAERRLAAAGLTVRRPGLLERLHGVRQVWLDKTGTLTFSQLELKDPGALRRLAPEARAALMGAAGASLHPVSRALFRELSALGQPWPAGEAEEIPGQGVRFRDAQGDWFLGRGLDGEGGPVSELSRQGVLVARFELRERLLDDAPAAVAELRARGLKVGLLSGDAPARVVALAAALGLPADAAHGGLSPAEKKTAVAATPALMLGDGLNDGPALTLAAASGTPAWERSVVADRTDFSFGGASLAFLPELFATATALRRAVWANLAFAAVYNLSFTALAVQGRFTPLVCAIVMPGSSLLVILATARFMGRRP